MRWLVRGAGALLGFFAVESAVAILRDIVLAPRLGPVAARAVGFAQGALLLALVAWLVYRPPRPPLTAPAVFAVATEWLVLGVLLEAAVGRGARGLSWSEIAAATAPERGTGRAPPSPCACSSSPWPSAWPGTGGRDAARAERGPQDPVGPGRANRARSVGLRITVSPRKAASARRMIAISTSRSCMARYAFGNPRSSG